MNLVPDVLVKMVAALAYAVAATTAAAAHPDKPIDVLTPFPAGGHVPTIAYVMAQRIGTLPGQALEASGTLAPELR